jgi:phosphatidate cytidylyltransferase
LLKTRALAALVFAPALLWIVWRGGPLLAAACLVLAALMLWEFLSLTLGAGEFYLKGLAFALGALVAVTTLAWLPEQVRPLVLPAGVLALFIAILARPEPIQQSITRAALIALGTVYACGLIPYLALLRGLPSGQGLALMALFCTWAADTGGYFAGRALGRHKLYPKISPAKTVEGLVGGLLAAVGAAFLIHSIHGLFAASLASWHLVAIGMIAALLGVAGDLCESMLKRSVGAKDSGTLIPGHGGVLDRFDAVMFVAPGLYLFVVVAFG